MQTDISSVLMDCLVHCSTRSLRFFVEPLVPAQSDSSLRAETERAVRAQLKRRHIANMNYDTGLFQVTTHEHESEQNIISVNRKDFHRISAHIPNYRTQPNADEVLQTNYEQIVNRINASVSELITLQTMSHLHRHQVQKELDELKAQAKVSGPRSEAFLNKMINVVVLQAELQQVTKDCLGHFFLVTSEAGKPMTAPPPTINQSLAFNYVTSEFQLWDPRRCLASEARIWQEFSNLSKSRPQKWLAIRFLAQVTSSYIKCQSYQVAVELIGLLIVRAQEAVINAGYRGINDFDHTTVLHLTAAWLIAPDLFNRICHHRI